jgi:hypothetical protein
MCWNKIYIVLGVPMNLKEVVSELFDREVTDDDDCEWYTQVVDTISRGLNTKVITISRLPDNHVSQPRYIKGVVLAAYDRMHTKCDDCEEYSCDKCIGISNNGFYDVTTILENPYQLVNLNHMCYNCYHDNKMDLGYIDEDTKVINRICQVDNDRVTQKCKNCNRCIDLRFCAKTILKKDYIYEEVKEFCGKQEPKLYYIIDDCLCCS